jgi:ATPase subunit of ABC transporter with duplicated ATPase domains
MVYAYSFSHVSFSIADRCLIHDFSGHVPVGARLGIIGPNGAGKSTLLKLLAGHYLPTSGALSCMDGNVSYVPQEPTASVPLSGAERFWACFSRVMETPPDILLLDEPTNHLDSHNREQLNQRLADYWGTVIIVSHDGAFLNTQIDTIWAIQSGDITVFKGRFSSYWKEIESQHARLQRQKEQLKNAEKEINKKHRQWQEKAAKRKSIGKKGIQNRKWPTVVSPTKLGRGTLSVNKDLAALREASEDINTSLKALHIDTLPIPTFSLSTKASKGQCVVSVSDGEMAYPGQAAIVEAISLHLMPGERIGIVANNASGKSTFLNALQSAPFIERRGEWKTPSESDIGYLDQHYEMVSHHACALAMLDSYQPQWRVDQQRRFLVDFLLKGAIVERPIDQLSAGERVRLSLAAIAAKTPRLLLLDEITNNIDWWTRQHLIQVLSKVPSTMIVVSHDTEFLSALSLDAWYTIENRRLRRREMAV